MDLELTDDRITIRKAVAERAAKSDDRYRGGRYRMDKDAAHEFPHEFPQEFSRALADGGRLGITTPEKYGGHGFGITEASLLPMEMAASGAGMNGAGSTHLSIPGTHPVIAHGSEETERECLPRIADGDPHLRFGADEPGTGLDSPRITTGKSAPPVP